MSKIFHIDVPLLCTHLYLLAPIVLCSCLCPSYPLVALSYLFNVFYLVLHPRDVLIMLNCVAILVRLDCFSHIITMATLTPTRCKTAKIHRIEPSPGMTIVYRN